MPAGPWPGGTGMAVDTLLDCAAAPAATSLPTMTPQPSKDPLHGVTLEAILQHLVKEVGWHRMADEIPVRCFMFDPSITSSLKFLRRTPWARTRVEEMYVAALRRASTRTTPG